MRLWIAALVLLFIAGLAVLFSVSRGFKAPATVPNGSTAPPALSGTDSRPRQPTASIAEVKDASAAAGAPGTNAESLVTSAPNANTATTTNLDVPATPESASLPPQIILENMRRTIRQYGSMFGGNPVGTNEEITKALQGDNPKQINFLKSDDGNRVNGNGELVDPWGTPYFFHQLSGAEMEIRSAGPDRKMWTGDDLVVK